MLHIATLCFLFMTVKSVLYREIMARFANPHK